MGLAVVDIFTGGDQSFKLEDVPIARGMSMPVADPSTVGGSVGTNWTKLLIGIQFAMDGAVDNISNPYLYLGLCSGTSQILGGGAPRHFMGGRFGGGTLTYAAGPPESFSNGAGAVTFQRNLNGTVVETGFGGSFQNRYSGDPEDRRGVLAMQFEKTGGNIVMWAGGQANATTYPDITTVKFKQLFDLTDLSDIGTWDSNYAAVENTTPLSDEQDVTNGWLDAINIYYNKTAIPAHKYGVHFKRLA